jgi:hypothetical protein
MNNYTPKAGSKVGRASYLKKASLLDYVSKYMRNVKYFSSDILDRVNFMWIVIDIYTYKYKHMPVCICISKCTRIHTYLHI